LAEKYSSRFCVSCRADCQSVQPDQSILLNTCHCVLHCSTRHVGLVGPISSLSAILLGGSVLHVYHVFCGRPRRVCRTDCQSVQCDLVLIGRPLWTDRLSVLQCISSPFVNRPRRICRTDCLPAVLWRVSLSNALLRCLVNRFGPINNRSYRYIMFFVGRPRRVCRTDCQSVQCDLVLIGRPLWTDRLSVLQCISSPFVNRPRRNCRTECLPAVLWRVSLSTMTFQFL
jgi:hypothetical protein